MYDISRDKMMSTTSRSTQSNYVSDDIDECNMMRSPLTSDEDWNAIQSEAVSSHIPVASSSPMVGQRSYELTPNIDDNEFIDSDGMKIVRNPASINDDDWKRMKRIAKLEELQRSQKSVQFDIATRPASSSLSILSAIDPANNTIMSSSSSKAIQLSSQIQYRLFGRVACIVNCVLLFFDFILVTFSSPQTLACSELLLEEFISFCSYCHVITIFISLYLHLFGDNEKDPYKVRFVTVGTFTLACKN